MIQPASVWTSLGSSRPGLQQFVKFCVVGASSAVIDFSTLYVLKFVLHLPLLLAATGAFLLAVTNGFYWNRRWTFAAQAVAGAAREQYPRFVATNAVGYLLNVSVMTMALSVGAHLGYVHTQARFVAILQLMATGEGKEVFGLVSVFAAKAIAVVCVTAWNFTASRLWTFRATPSAPQQAR